MKTTALLLILLFLGRGVEAGPDAAAKIRVVTTLPDYADLARRLAGDRIEVSAIVRGDQDAHFIRPKPSFVSLVGGADLLVATGLDLELWLPTVVDKSANRRVRSGEAGYVAASQGMTLLEKPHTLSRIEGGLHIYGNPHVTCSPLLMKVAARNIAVGLAKVDPASRETYTKNLAAFEKELDSRLFGPRLIKLLGSRALTRLGETGKLVPFLTERSYKGKPLADYAGGWLAKMLPLKGLPIVTYHKNWVYFVTLFDLKVVGTVEPKPGIPPSPRHVAELVETMRKEHVHVIFAANYFDEHKVRTVAADVGATPVIVPLYTGGAPGTETYFKLVDFWVDSLVKAAK